MQSRVDLAPSVHENGLTANEAQEHAHDLRAACIKDAPPATLRRDVQSCPMRAFTGARPRAQRLAGTCAYQGFSHLQHPLARGQVRNRVPIFVPVMCSC